MQYKLYNLEHGILQPQTIDLHPFKIIILEKHIENAKKLFNPSALILVGNLGNGPRKIQRRKINRGSWLETALIEIKRSHSKQSNIYFDSKTCFLVDDVCAILSLFTGRKVCTRKGAIGSAFSVKFDSPFKIHHFWQEKDSYWQAFNRISEDKIRVAIGNLVLMYQSRQMFELACYASAVLNVFYEDWWSKNGKSAYNATNQEAIETLKNEVKAFIEKDFTNRKITADSREFTSKVDGFGDVSAIEKIKAFLISLDLYPQTDTKEVLDRLKLLNQARNRFVHSGDMHRIKLKSSVHVGEINYAVIDMTALIALYYFAFVYLNGKGSAMLLRAKQIITDFFINGVCNGKHILDETTAEYLKRLEVDWTRSGTDDF